MGLLKDILNKLGIEGGDAAEGSPTGYAASTPDKEAKGTKATASKAAAAKSAATSKPAAKGAATKPAPKAAPGVKGESGVERAAAARRAAAAAAAPKEMPMVDVVAKLDAMAKVAPEKLDWKVSIVDLLKLLGMDSSFKAREALAKELGCPEEYFGGDYAKMNIWTHKTVLNKIAENGGNIPPSLLK